MSTAQVVETSVTVNNNSPIQDYVHPDDQTQPRPQGFSRPTHFLKEKPWGGGWIKHNLLLWGFLWEKTYRFCNLRKWKYFD